MGHTEGFWVVNNGVCRTHLSNAVLFYNKKNDIANPPSEL